MAPYKDLCKNMEKDVEECLMADLQVSYISLVKSYKYVGKEC